MSDKIKEYEAALEFYANKDNWKDIWKEESEHFKYYYQLRQRTNDFENISKDSNYIFVAGKRARAVLLKHKKELDK